MMIEPSHLMAFALGVLVGGFIILLCEILAWLALRSSSGSR